MLLSVVLVFGIRGGHGTRGGSSLDGMSYTMQLWILGIVGVVVAYVLLRAMTMKK